jgi:caa(3)-type oxidase subunit IV
MSDHASTDKPTSDATPAHVHGPDCNHDHAVAHGHGGDGHDDHDWSSHIRTYLKVGAILFGGTCLTVAAAYMPIFDLHGRAGNLTLGLAIATVKCTLVALIFMHLNGEKKLIYKFLLFTAVFFAVMMFLFLTAQSDPLPADKSGNMVHHNNR